MPLLLLLSAAPSFLPLGGVAMTADLAMRAGWARERCDKVLAELLREGLAMIDDGDPSGQRLYWFPALAATSSSSAAAAAALDASLSGQERASDADAVMREADSPSNDDG